MRPRPPLLPHLPDVVLRRIFSMLTYKQQCAVEGSCRRYQNILLTMMRRDIHEVIIETIGATRPIASQMVAFRRLNITCPADSFDFLSGVLRRSRLSVMRMTSDIAFLANISRIHVNKEERRKYFSNVEDLWLLMIRCTDELTERFMEVEEKLFNEISTLTLQVHVNKATVGNVGRVIRTFVSRHPKALINLELHADRQQQILDQMAELPSFPFNKIKIICTDFDLPRISLDYVHCALKEQTLKPKHLTFRDWSVWTSGEGPLAPNPLDSYRISCCDVENVDKLEKALQITNAQERPKILVKRKVLKKKKTDETVIEEPPKKVVKKVVKKKKKLPYIKKLEVAGQCTLKGLQFLQNKAHLELEKRLSVTIPAMEVDTSEIYYCF